MAKRRGHGEGTIYFRQSDNRWVAQVTLDNGKRKTKRFKTQREAQKWLLEARKAKENGVLLDADNIRFSEFLDRWLSDVAKHTVRPKTFESYSYLVNSHIKPSLGHLRLVAIRPDHLQKLYAEKLQSGLSPRTVQYIHALIHRSLGQALKWGLVVRNAADVVEAPRVRRKAPQTLTAGEVRRFLEAARNERWYALYVCAIGLGLRQGELLGLKWGDVDLERGVIGVKQGMQYLRRQGMVETDLKSEKSRRLIQLPGFVIRALKQHRKLQLEERLRAGGEWQDLGLVFTTGHGTPIHPRNLVRHFHQMLAKAGLPQIRFHDLRHTYASLLLAKNVHPRLVQEALGHASITLTLDTYSHLLPDIQHEVASKMDDILSW